MKKQMKLMDVVQRLDKEDVIKYASNIGCELDESLDVKELRQAYSDYVLAHPKEILIRLPKGDLDAIGRVKKAKSPVDSYILDLHLVPIMVQYGLADAEAPYEDAVGIDVHGGRF